MGMTIEEAIERYKNNAEYERAHGNLQGCLEFRQLAEWLRKYQKIAYLINQAEYAGENSYTGEGEWILADKAYQKIQEILKDGND